MRLSWLVVLVSMVAGCASDDVDEHGSDEVEIDELGAANRLAYCTYLTRCGVFPEPSACMGAELGGSFEPDPDLIVAINAGRVLYRGDKARACADANANATCDWFDLEPAIQAACSDVMTGTLASGAPCLINEECASFNCDGGGNGMTCAIGTCLGDVWEPVMRAPIGARCEQTSDCVDEAYCDSVCTKRKGANEPCASADACDHPLLCQGAPAVCTLLPGEGEPCDGQCRAWGLACTSRGICEKVRLPPATCTESADCSPYYPCNLELGVCAPLPALGMPCDWFEHPCVDDDTFCDWDTSLCVPVRAVGEPCRISFECAFGCEGPDGARVCTPPPAVCF